MFSAQEHPNVVQAYLEKEHSMGWLLGPFTPESLSMPPSPGPQVWGDPKGA